MLFFKSVRLSTSKVLLDINLLFKKRSVDLPLIFLWTQYIQRHLVFLQ